LEKTEKFDIMTFGAIVLTIIMVFFILFGITGCGSKDSNVIIKQEYVKPDLPKLQKVSLKDLNLSNEEKKPLTLHLKIIKKDK